MTFPEIKHLKWTASSRFVLIAGPCVIENEKVPREICETLVALSEKHQVPLIFKASYRKANRTKVTSFTGIGDDAALRILADIRQEFQVPVLTDIHSDHEASLAAKVVDVLQIPAFLCRQTQLLQAAGSTGACVNIKKGQFLSPEAMQFAVEKVRQTGNQRVMVTERGTTFGYQDLVVDFRGIPIMQNFAPVIVDCTHSLQQPNQAAGVTGGLPQLIQTIASAAIAVGASGLFIETHPDPPKAMSDGANMLPMARMDQMMQKLVALHDAVIN